MAKRILTVGIAGLGRSGYSIHAKWLREAPKQYKIVAASDGLASRRADAARDFGCRTYRDYHQLIAKEDPDLIINALPSNLHPKGTIDALRGGHNVVCEKPLAVKVRDIDRMIDAARKARKLFAPFQNSRFFPYFRKIQEVIASGKLGRIIHIRTNWSGFARRWDWQTRQDQWGGNLNNTGPHPVDHAVMLFGSKTPKVFCRMASGEGSFGDAEDFCALTLYGKGSPTIEVLLSSYEAFAQGDRISVSGEYGGLAGGPEALRWKYFDPAEVTRQKRHRSWSHERGYCRESLPWKSESWKLPKSKLGHFERNSKAFYNNIHDVLTGKDKLVVTPAEVRRQVAVIEEAHRQNPLPKLGKRS